MSSGNVIKRKDILLSPFIPTVEDIIDEYYTQYTDIEITDGYKDLKEDGRSALSRSLTTEDSVE